MRKEITVKKVIITCDDCGTEIDEGKEYKCDKTGKDLCYECKYTFVGSIEVILCKEEYDLLKYNDEDKE